MSIGALNLLSQVGATTPERVGPGARLPTLSLLAQDSEGNTNTAGSATARVSPVRRENKAHVRTQEAHPRFPAESDERNIAIGRFGDEHRTMRLRERGRT